MSKKTVEVEVDGRRLKLSNLDKVMYPATGFTKGQLIDYYTRIAPAVLPHLEGRPLTLKRYPDGVDGKFFYEKQAPSHRPEWVRRTERIPTGQTRPFIDFVICDDLPTLVWLANLADIELHTSLSKAANIGTPTTLAFDLDPGPPAAILDCARVALLLRELLEQLGMKSFPKTSGSKGMQVYAPINGKASYEQTKPLARAIAQLLERQHDDMIVSKMTKSLRKGKVFIDWSQNTQSKTTVNVYSLRARELPTVSTPVEWSEVETALEADDADSLVFEFDAVLERFDTHGDPFAEVPTLRQPLPDAAVTEV